MQFKYPELLYALFLLLIPIIIHLFQLRKFQKEAFTNVAILKEITLQTRKSSQIKKWLVLLTRIFLLAAIIMAFAQPFTAKTDTFNAKNETVIYLDNSFSMQKKGNQGTLLKRAVQDIITSIPEDENISLLTNYNTYKNTTIKAIKNDLLQLGYSASSLSYDAALLKSKTLFSKHRESLKNLVFISDFQQKETDFNPEPDSLIRTYAVKLKPKNTHNISIDSAYISKTTATTIELTVSLKNNGGFIENLPISLYNDDTLIAKTSVPINTDATTTFSLPSYEVINGKITIEDANLQFDNNLFFNINKASKINVLTINSSTDLFLKKIFTKDEFNYSSTPINLLNYNILEQQNLIVLNELSSVPNGFVSALKSFTDQGGTLIIIPSKGISTKTYNTFLSHYNLNFKNYIEAEKRITTINYSHPLYNKGVFEKQVKNFQYPKVNGYYNVAASSGYFILQYEDGKPFLSQNKNVFVFTSPLNSNDSNFKSSPLIVPTLYNIGKFSLKIPALYYTIGQENTFDVAVKLQQDDILSLSNNTINIIPKQYYLNTKVVISTNKNPSISNIYIIKNKNENIQNVSYNYNRSESHLVYQDLSALTSINQSNSISGVFNTIKSDSKVNELWKWFVIFALAFLVIEMLILKYFK